MAAGTSPIFVDTVKFAHTSIGTANTGRDGTGTMGTVVTGGADGSRIDEITVSATATTTAGMVRFFTYDGSTIKLFKEITVIAVTVAAATPAFTYTLKNYDLSPLLFLESGDELRASTHNGEGFSIVVNRYGDY